MKKIFISIIIIFVIIFIGIFTFNRLNNKNSSNLVNVKVSEVAHSVFYAPQYLAHALGYFEDEGLDVDINLTAGADAVMASVLSGDADIGFCGTEATIYVASEDEKGVIWLLTK